MTRGVWLVLLVSCVASDARADDISFTRTIVPIFKSRCVICHMPGSEQAGLALHPNGGYANLIDVKSTESTLMRVAPGSAEKSYLYRKLLGTHAAAGGSGERMPFGDASLSDTQLDAIRRWIESGARND